jgi:cytochrome c biogenesis protein CcdA
LPTRKIAVKTFAKRATLWIFVFAVGLYTTFVLQQLWNWFIVTALHASELSYWEMYGVTMLVFMLLEPNPLGNEERWEQTLTMGIWTKIGAYGFGKLVGNSAALGIGWVVHTFLV